MNSPSARLGAFLRHRAEFTIIDDATEYKRVRVQLHQRGVVLRDYVVGASVKTKKQQLVRSGDIIFAEIDAKLGGFGVIPHDLDGGIVSSHYFLFDIDESIADRTFVSHLMRWPSLAEQVRAQGSTNYAAIRPSDVLEYLVPLPPLASQKRIGRDLDAMRKDTDRVSALGDRASSVTDALLRSWLEHHVATSGPLVPLGDVADVRRGRGPRYAPDTPFLALNQACVQWSGIRLENARSVEESWWRAIPEVERAKVGDVLVNSTGEGTIGRALVVTNEGVGLPIDSHVLGVRVNPQVIDPGFLAAFLRSPSGQASITAVKGANTTNQTELGKTKLEALLVPCPPIAEQGALAAAFHSLELAHSRITHLRETAGNLQMALPIAATASALIGSG